MDNLLTDDSHNHRTELQIDRSGGLLAAARDHVRNARPEAAIAIWRQLLHEGGDSGHDAFVDYADYIVRRREGIEWRALQDMMAKKGESPLTILWTGALLETEGRLVEALNLYTQEIEKLTEEELSTSRWGMSMVSARRRVKWALGLELSGIDLEGEVGEVEGVDRYFDLLDLLRRPSIVHGWAQVWSREELAGARERSPWRVTAESVEAYYREVEGTLRRYDERVMIELWTFELFAQCAEVAEGLLAKQRRGDDLGEPTQRERVGVAWPPERNQSCWCGSGTKYKKCCGAGRPPALRQAWGPAGLRAGAELAVGRV